MSHHVAIRSCGSGFRPGLTLLYGAQSSSPQGGTLRKICTPFLPCVEIHQLCNPRTSSRHPTAAFWPSSIAGPHMTPLLQLPQACGGSFILGQSRYCLSFNQYRSPRPPFHTLIWLRTFHGRDHRCFYPKRQQNFSTTSSQSSKLSGQKTTSDPLPLQPQSPPTASPPQSSGRGFYSRLPQIPHYHRPTKEELLAAATGFWSRLKIRFKWFSIRSVRPFNNDEIGALFSWVLFGHILWVILGTTTFFSLAILMINTVFAQETLARGVGNYLTKSSGIRVVFESAIVPKWRDGVITFKNVFVSRRPGLGNAKVSKGSAETAAAAAAATAAERTNDANEEEDTNYTQFDLTLDTVNVTLSFNKWFNGQGLLHDVEVKGVRGVIDRRHVRPASEEVDPKSYRHEHSPGDFEIEHFKMDDFLVTVHQPGGFRPFSVSIYSCDLPRLRQQWLFYDFLCANTVSGSFDDSLFTIHPRQTLGQSNIQRSTDSTSAAHERYWKKHSRLRIDALKIDHLNRGTEGPFSWIHEGTVDLIADVMFPADSDESIITKLVSELKGVGTFGVIPAEDNTIYNDNIRGVSVTVPPTSAKSNESKRFLVMDLRVNFHDVRAAVPLLTRDLSYVNNALIRPIVAYINSRKTFIPINCRVIKRADDFDGSWTLYDSGLLDDLSAETYTAIVKDIYDDRARMRRFKKVGLWSLQLAVQALFMGMAGNLA